MSSSNLNYWYNNFSGGAITSELPSQAIPSTKKNAAWKKSVMDALESIGLKQFEENTRFLDYYRMCDNKVSFTELSELIPQLREVENILEDFDIPATIKHYDILGIIVNFLQTVMFQNKDKFHPTCNDEIKSNEYLREKTELVQKFVNESIEKEIQIKLAERGLDVNKQNFNSPEEQQAYLAEIEANRKELTPPEIEEYMNKEWRPIALDWAIHTLIADETRFRTNEIDRENIGHFLKTGRCFQHFFVGYDSYGTEVWKPLNTFFSQTTDVKYPQYGEYIGNVDFFTPSDFVNKEGYLLTEAQKHKILKTNTSEDAGDGGALGGHFTRSLSKLHSVPHEQHYDYQFMLGVQEQSGIPMANRTIYKKDGTSETFKDFLPDNFNGSNGNRANRYAKLLRDDLNLRTDMIMRTIAYFRSYQRVGYVTYVTETGRIESEIVTDELLPGFLEEYGIKELKNITLAELAVKREPNTVVWDYVPQIWKGKKASTSITSLGEDLYYDIEPLEFQIKGDSNIFDLQLPVAGIIDQAPADKILPWQNFYNITTNTEYNLIEKEIGLFFVFDIAFIPSDIKGYGDTETTLINFKNIVKNVGLFGVDGSQQNLNGKSAFNQFAAQDLSLGNQIAAKQAQAEYYKAKAFEQFGLTPPALGQPVKYQTAEGVKQGVESTNTQTDYLYETFSDFKSRALEIHLNVAQYAQGEGKDISVMYTKGDLSQAFLKFSDKDFPLRQFGIMAVSDAKKRKELEVIKSYMLNQNTMDTDSLELASLVTSDSMISLMSIAKMERIRKEKAIQEQRVHEEKIVAETSRLADESKQKEWEREEITNQRDRDNEVNLKRIESLGRAVDDNGDIAGLEYINKEADRALNMEQMQTDKEFKEKEFNLKLEEQKNNYKKGEKDLSIKMKELALKEKQIENDRLIALVNKN